MKERQLFFDLDRTLWDFETNSKAALNQLFEHHQLGDTIEHFLHFHHTYVRVNAELWQQYGKGKLTKEELRDERFKKALAHHEIYDEGLAQKMSDGYIERTPYQTNLFPGALEMLEDLKKENYRMHIITNGFQEVQHIKLENSGLKPYFDMILCSEEVGFTKPHREIFDYALQKTACKAENAVMIGDDMKADVLGALGAGWRAVHFDPEVKFKKEREIPRVRSLSEIPEVIALMPY